MATLTAALNTVFTPNSGPFNVQCTGGRVQLERRNTPDAAWAILGVVENGQALIVDNYVLSTGYRFVGISGLPVVQADQ